MSAALVVEVKAAGLLVIATPWPSPEATGHPLASRSSE